MNFHGTILRLWSILYCFSEWDWKSLNSSLIVFSSLDMPALYMYWVLQSRLDAFHYSQSEWQGSPELKGSIKSRRGNQWENEKFIWIFCQHLLKLSEKPSLAIIKYLWHQPMSLVEVNQANLAWSFVYKII